LSALDSPGYDLLALMTGSEGLLGIVVEVTVKLLVKPERAQVVLAAFDSVETAGAAVADHRRRPAAGRPGNDGQPVDPRRRRLRPRRLSDRRGGDPAVRTGRFQRRSLGTDSGVREVLLNAGATEVRTAEDDAQRMKFWAGRKGAFPAVGRISPDYYCMDGTIPRQHLARVLGRIGELSTQYGLRVANVFHAGDGNLHPLILFDANQPDELHRAEAFGTDILKLCVEVGGTVTGEHGVGVEKLDAACSQFTPEELSQFHAIKAAFDPDGLLNPGKAVPTLHRCAEMGRMHVHGGALPFPELPRF
jgi:glycolate oxidase